MPWTTFESPIKKKPVELGLELGPKNCISILDVPFGYYVVKTHDLGAAYIQVCNSDSADLAVKKPSTTLGISQLIAFLDVVLNLDENVCFTPKFFTSFEVGGKLFLELTEESIELIKTHGRVRAFFNKPEFIDVHLSMSQICFHQEEEEPLWGEAYVDQSKILEERLRRAKRGD